MKDRIRLLRKTLDLTQTQFGENIGVSISVIKNLEYGLTEANSLLISSICKTYHVNRVWLETGEGDMFEERSREEQVASAIGKWMGEPEQNDFKIKLIGYLTEMSEDEWQLLYNMAKKLTDK